IKAFSNGKEAIEDKLLSRCFCEATTLQNIVKVKKLVIGNPQATAKDFLI
ncbi:13427_t:CDS:1, partial [Cetraspora pellucida]